MTETPIVIAHRGASGYLPEHTLAAKALAYGLGADFLEQDVVATRDGALVVLHDLHLDDVSDVARRFTGRQRADGRHYVIDFGLAELQTLRLFERRLPGSTAPRYPDRFPADVPVAGITTLADELRLVQGLNKSMRREVGIYPEIKEPAWHRRHGVDLAARLTAGRPGVRPVLRCGRARARQRPSRLPIEAHPARGPRAAVCAAIDARRPAASSGLCRRPWAALLSARGGRFRSSAAAAIDPGGARLWPAVAPLYVSPRRPPHVRAHARRVARVFFRKSSRRGRILRPS